MQPHTEEWFDALEKINPQQAAHMRAIIARTGTGLVCGLCGDTPPGDYGVIGAPIPARWCDDCRDIQEAMGVRSKLRTEWEPLIPELASRRTRTILQVAYWAGPDTYRFACDDPDLELEWDLERLEADTQRMLGAYCAT